MPFYHQLGKLPHKRHIQFRQPDGSLYHEQVMGTKGFSGIQSILYHVNPPTQVSQYRKIRDWIVTLEEEGANRHRHFFTFRHEAKGDCIDGRVYSLANEDCAISTVYASEPMDYFYRNADGDEVLFIHEGSGKLETIFGELPFQQGDYLVIPIGTTYRVVADTYPIRMLVVETTGEITIPRRYRNEYGQLAEHSPFCERDIRIPTQLVAYESKGSYEVRVKARNQLHGYTYDFHPLDVVGWDGYLHPWAFSIHDFEPITGSIHQPPPVHQTFAGPNFVICSFVPRMYDYHPEAVPAPYYHSNVESDEVLYYVRGNFMSRNGIQEGSITLHPSGIPHGPHPGKVEGSIGKTRTEELAVMIDTFRPLKIAESALETEDTEYMLSWNRKS
ncbi:homogentisate 1,2-dioxygenase [Croceifilum oryzae]|uniref:Homogentisate 1,2-dioxygenase n=1 Tax=Croceifilum oryzae TaxID=1553429 RepID=A0AAJ1TJY8_9BACL|nr:homogentisate 1,2-dioxygenase [Croceifilum oryzae]MDQ0417501.1 homogentisate 1,2-dioxygenase [Croceifilum oryzae]